MSRHFKISALLLTFVATSALAASDGFYVGANGGWGVAKYQHNDFPYMSSANFQDNNFAFGANFGYQFSELLATEIAYTRLSGIKVNNITMASNTPGGLTTLPNSNIALNIFDLALRGLIPLRDGFGLNAKVGAAYVKPALSSGLVNPSLGSAYSNDAKVLPELGAGVSYDFNKNTLLGFNFAQIFGHANIPNIYTAMFNLGYHFG